MKSEQIADVSRSGGVLFYGLHHEVSNVTFNVMPIRCDLHHGIRDIVRAVIVVRRIAFED